MVTTLFIYLFISLYPKPIISEIELQLLAQSDSSNHPSISLFKKRKIKWLSIERDHCKIYRRLIGAYNDVCASAQFSHGHSRICLHFSLVCETVLLYNKRIRLKLFDEMKNDRIQLATVFVGCCYFHCGIWYIFQPLSRPAEMNMGRSVDDKIMCCNDKHGCDIGTT